MSDEANDLTAFTQRLADVPPSPGKFQRDALLYAAGLAAGRRGRFWPAAAATLALLAAGLGTTLVIRPPSVVATVRVVVVPAPPPMPEPVPSPQQERPPLASAPLAAEWIEGVRLRERMLRDGVSPTSSIVWAALPRATMPNEIPDLSALRLNATHLPGEQFP